MRSTILYVALLAATAAACNAAADGNADDVSLAASGQSEHGERLYQQHCASCHEKGVGGAPPRAALEQKSADAIKQALTSGVMKGQGAVLDRFEVVVLAEQLGRVSPSPIADDGKRCNRDLAFAGQPLWNRWGNSEANTRYQPDTSLDAANVDQLELAWAFGFPSAQRARSQPAVTEEAIFTGSQSGRVYALDAGSGCIYWTFDAGSEVRNAPLIGTDAKGIPDTLYFGDFDATVYAVNAATGKLRWRKSVKDHPDGTITGSLALHDGRLFVPMSSTEVLSAYDDEYECCSFRGGVTALSAADGRKLWRWHSVAKPVATKAGEVAPSGAPVWSTPTVDAARGLLYVGTGENYSSPANENSDAIIALDMATGRKRWAFQATTGDAWNSACGRLARANCPSEDGPDFDFGAPPILIRLSNGKDIILAGQKSGEIFGLDPAAGGKVLWRQRVGMGGFNGGIHWGMASDGVTLWVGIADTPGSRFAKGSPRPGLHAFDAATGKPRWSRIEKPNCSEASYACISALSAPVTATRELVFAGAHNGRLIAYSAMDGSRLWMAETNRSFATVNGIEAKGGTIDGQGPVVAGNLVIVNSGYDKFGEIPGNVLLVYRRKGDAK